MIRQDWYITRHEGEMWADLFFFSIINTLVFGLIATHFAGNDATAGIYVLSGMLMWEVIRLCQYTVTIISLMNVWSSNLSNMFIAPVSLPEYVAAAVISACVKTLMVCTPLSIAVYFLFDFNILSAGPLVLLIAFVDLVFFAVFLGMVLLGMIFMFGTRVQALAWSAVYLFQPLIGVYFPLDVLPGPVQAVANLVPATHAFSGVRNAITGEGDVYGPLLTAGVLGLITIAIGYVAFSAMQRKSMVTGQFARNDA